MSWRKDIWPLMCTCRFLYAAGMPHLLACNVELNLGVYRSTFASFSSFILADTDLRAGSLRDLRLNSTGYLGERITSDLVEILQHASGLKMFTLNWLRIPLSPVDKLVLRTLAQNESIKHLSIFPLSPEVVSEIQRWRAPLNAVTTTSVSADHLDPSILPVDITSALQPFSSTLQKLSVTGRWRWSSDTEVVFPHMRSLSISHSTIESPGNIARAFPNLERLQMRDASAAGPDKSARQRNLIEMNPYWASLALLEGRVEDIYRLGLLSRVQHLKVSLYPSSHSAHQLATLSRIAQPTRLDLCISWTISADSPRYLKNTAISAKRFMTDLDIVCSVPDHFSWEGGQVYVSKFFVRSLHAFPLADGLLTRHA